jgi:hypothetical protein
MLCRRELEVNSLDHFIRQNLYIHHVLQQKKKKLWLYHARSQRHSFTDQLQYRAKSILAIRDPPENKQRGLDAMRRGTRPDWTKDVLTRNQRRVP